VAAAIFGVLLVMICNPLAFVSTGLLADVAQVVEGAVVIDAAGANTAGLAGRWCDGKGARGTEGKEVRRRINSPAAASEAAELGS
jgi:hypothetical protein